MEKDISASAFLVNESRARNEALSLDIHAKLWVDEDVRKLWTQFNDEVYNRDPRAMAVRNRFFLGRLNDFFSRHPGGLFLNIAAGFTSYPYLMDPRVETVEVDLPDVVTYKSRRVKEFQEAGQLPRRRVCFLAADLNSDPGRRALEASLAGIIRERPSFILLEGISYYLDPVAFGDLMAQAARIQCPGSEVAMDYWLPEVVDNGVFNRFRDFLARRCGHPLRQYHLMTPNQVGGIEGYFPGVETDVSAVERMLCEAPILQDWEGRIPENFVVLIRG